MACPRGSCARDLVRTERVIPLLVQATPLDRPLQVHFDLEGRALVLDALTSLVRFRVWSYSSMAQDKFPLQPWGLGALVGA